MVERHEAGWFASAHESSVHRAGIRYSLDRIIRPAPGLLSATVTYQLDDGRRWVQSFTAELDDDSLGQLLGRHGLEVDRRLDEVGAWVRAVPIR